MPGKHAGGGALYSPEDGMIPSMDQLVCPDTSGAATKNNMTDNPVTRTGCNKFAREKRVGTRKDKEIFLVLMTPPSKIEKRKTRIFQGLEIKFRGSPEGIKIAVTTKATAAHSIIHTLQRSYLQMDVHMRPLPYMDPCIHSIREVG
jgi:hypothetical protein